ncbi:hypothetical protein H6F86_24670 [Phormidium sp. FACHB-592]|uniref:Uncharacterized protein n=1 Tax=Stenomitos frigidus AS-A4 TaxID=2933935 RepID=A0ABV0KKM2_9CYAN|nr:hypothetical protein [Phormidium sp. FACHB-592]MBD2077022.1 hypothetical protein [Phormidium sp. FACHB-592]
MAQFAWSTAAPASSHCLNVYFVIIQLLLSRRAKLSTTWRPGFNCAQPADIAFYRHHRLEVSIKDVATTPLGVEQDARQ